MIAVLPVTPAYGAAAWGLTSEPNESEVLDPRKKPRLQHGSLQGPGSLRSAEAGRFSWDSQPPLQDGEVIEESLLQHDVKGKWQTISTADRSAPYTYYAVMGGEDLRLRAKIVTNMATYVSAKKVVKIVIYPTEWETLQFPPSVVDGKPALIKFKVSNRDHRLTKPYVFTLERRTKKRPKRWRAIREGKGRNKVISVRPRVTTQYRLTVEDRRGQRLRERFRIRNLPPGPVVTYPRGAPRPNVAPLQRRARAGGAGIKIRNIPAKLWQRMQGISWRPGCVPRRHLRLVRVHYWAYDGYLRRGRLIVHESVAHRVGAVFRDFHRLKVPIRSIYPVDRFGYLPRLKGANDYASMAAGNTSAFNCRDVVGRPGVRSNHSTGRAIDINPWENTYASSGGRLPNSWWTGKTVGKYAWGHARALVPRIMAKHGATWTYGNSDEHHFDFR